jgi:hypothetical protein
MLVVIILLQYRLIQVQDLGLAIIILLIVSVLLDAVGVVKKIMERDSCIPLRHYV